MKGANLDPRIALYRREKRRVARRVVPGWAAAVKEFAKVEAHMKTVMRGGRPRKYKGEKS